jgi:NPCBM/NEW2 domain
LASPTGATSSPQAGLAYLSDMNPVQGGQEYRLTTSATVSGTVYIHSVTLYAYAGSGRSAALAYDTGRHYERFRATLGLRDDTSRSDIPVRFQVLADGHELFNSDLTFGQAVPIDLDITNILRLTIEVTPLKIDNNSNPDLPCVWGDARVGPQAVR